MISNVITSSTSSNTSSSFSSPPQTAMVNAIHGTGNVIAQPPFRPAAKTPLVLLPEAAEPSRGEAKTFVQFSSCYGSGQHTDLYRRLDSFLTVPVELSSMNVREGKTAAGEIELTVSWNQTSPEYQPSASEKIQDKEQVTEQFKMDLNRSNYIIEFLDDTRINLEREMPVQKQIDDIFVSVFGKEHLARISEVAHQGHVAECATVGISMMKGDNFIVQEDNYPQHIIKKQEDGSCRIISSITFNVNTLDPDGGNKPIDNLTIEMTRTNVLLPEHNDKTKLLSGCQEEKEGMYINIRYAKCDKSVEDKSSSGFVKKLGRVFNMVMGFTAANVHAQ